MTSALFDQCGNQKYLTARERMAFVYAASNECGAISTFCLTPAFTGARISEVLALTATRVDAADEAVVFETLKQRKKQIFRAVPVPRALIPLAEHGVRLNSPFQTAENGMMVVRLPRVVIKRGKASSGSHR